MKVLNIYKPTSTTPFELIQYIKERFPETVDKKIGYAGRLDPMAHGVMLFLIGDENKNRKKYENLTKTYKTKIIFGLQTDTYDAMGIITSVNKNLDLLKTKSISHKYISELRGLILQKFPPFSSAMVDGKRLYNHAREGNLANIKFPQKEIFIYKSDITNFKKVNFNNFRDEFISKINAVNGDFRQEEIITQWNKLDNINLIIADAYFEVSSGTYIRSIANDLGGIAYDIYRTQAGDFKVKDSIKII